MDVAYRGTNVGVRSTDWGAIWAGVFSFMAIWSVFGALGLSRRMQARMQLSRSPARDGESAYGASCLPSSRCTWRAGKLEGWRVWKLGTTV